MAVAPANRHVDTLISTVETCERRCQAMGLNKGKIPSSNRASQKMKTRRNRGHTGYTNIVQGKQRIR
eukprot:2821628-Pleurochrysis_carterae.AAC.1